MSLIPSRISSNLITSCRLYAAAISLAYDFLSDFDDGSSNDLINLLASHTNILPTQLTQIKKKVLIAIEF